MSLSSKSPIDIKYDRKSATIDSVETKRVEIDIAQVEVCTMTKTKLKKRTWLINSSESLTFAHCDGKDIHVTFVSSEGEIKKG